MSEAYTFRWDALMLPQWHCKSTSRHLRTPVRSCALDTFDYACQNVKFLWRHRDPAKAPGSVRSSDDTKLAEPGAEQPTLFAGGIGRTTQFRNNRGGGRLVDVPCADLQADPIDEIRTSRAKRGLIFRDVTRAACGGERMRTSPIIATRILRTSPRTG